MKHKDLAEEYAIKEYEYINEENDLIFEDNKCFTFNDIKAAFNAGRESIIETIPRLNWEQQSADQYIAEMIDCYLHNKKSKSRAGSTPYASKRKKKRKK